MKTLSTLFFSLFVICLSAQHPGDLYTDFGEEGIYKIENADTLFIAYAIGVMTEGSIIAAGNYTKQSDNNEQIFVTKVDKQGHPVPFGNFSRGFQYGFTDDEKAEDILILPDGNILIAGDYKYESDIFPFVIKLLPNGQLDNEFGVNGVFTNTLKEMRVYAMDIFYTADSYSIILCGASQDTASLLMIDNEGIVVNTFGNDGFIQTNESYSKFNDLEIDSENNDLYVSEHRSPDYSTILKYNLPNGTPDTDFGEEGLVVISEYNNTVRKIIYSPEEKSLTGFGQYITGASSTDAYACRFNANDGSADNSFGVAGFLALPLPSTWEYILSATLQSDDKYYFLVYSYSAIVTETYICRVNHNGYADTTFGVNGFVQLDFEVTDFLYHTLSLSPAEDIVYVAGYLGAIHDNLKIAAYHTGYRNISAVDRAESLGKADFFYPNPVRDVLTVETGLNGLQQVQIFDITGKELLKYNFTGESFMLNLEMLQPSVYFIRVTLPDGQAITNKLVKN